MVPVAAPLEDVAVHVVQAPVVGGVTANFCGPTERGTRLSSVIRLPLEVRLRAAELVAKCSGGCCPRSARVFPLRFGGQPELPFLREDAGLTAKFSKFMAERLGFGEVDVSDREGVSLGQFVRERTRQRSHRALPVALCRLVFGHPKTFGQRHLDLVFAWTPFGFAARAAHDEFARRTPA